MTQRDMAGYLGVTTVTIKNWRRDKPNLYEIVLKRFAFDEAVKASKENYEKLLEISKNSSKK
jgi:transcriptional regulator with XRE-family HTH domain